MIRLDNSRENRWEVIQYSSLASIERERVIGYVFRAAGGTNFITRVPDEQGGESIAFVKSLPAAINALIDLHKLTDYQYAPWPAMEEDEE